MPPRADFDAVSAVKALLRRSRSGALATLMADSGAPYCSLVNTATDVSGAPLLLLSELARHTKNILKDSRVSLMLDERAAGDPLEGARIMVGGSAARIDERDRAPARARYLARHPSAETFVDFGDFAFFRIAPDSVHLVAGFGLIMDVEGPAVLTDLTDADDLVSGEAGAIAHMNADHRDAIGLYATRLLGAAAGDWRITGIDPDGADLALVDKTLRLDFPERVANTSQLRKILVAMAGDARSRA